MDPLRGVIIVGGKLVCTGKWTAKRRDGHLIRTHTAKQEVAATNDVCCYSLLLLLRDGS